MALNGRGPDLDIETIKSRVMRGLATPAPLMIAPELFVHSKDFARPKYDLEGAKKLLADAGYWHGEQMQRIVDRGVEVLIPPDTGRRRTTRRNWDGGRYDEMRQVLASDRGSELGAIEYVLILSADAGG